MKIEYLNNNRDGALIRLFDFDEGEVREFKSLLDQLSEGQIQSFALHEHCNIDPQDNCHLTFTTAGQDQGIQPKGPEFECALTPSAISSISELVGSFAYAPAEGYEWLDETGDISLLIAPDKRW